MHRRLVIGLFALGSPGCLWSPKAFACVACFGRSDSPLAEGMNMGILALLGVLFTVFALLTGFFAYLWWRSARQPSHPHRAVSSPSASIIQPWRP